MGGLRVLHQGRNTTFSPEAITRFRTHKTGALLALLAYRRKSWLRELIIEELWSSSDVETGRNNLRIALSSLRRQLEPPGISPGAVVVADRHRVGLHPQTVTSDVAEFEAALESARNAQETDKILWLSRACELYQHPLLPGFYENWVLPEQERLEHRFLEALVNLVELLTEQGDVAAARNWVQRGLSIDEQHSQLLALQQSFIKAPRQRTTLLIPPAALPQQTQLATPSVAGAGTLPPRLTRYFGDEATLNRLLQLLSEPETRLVTLFGAGGSGKTRTSCEVAHRLVASPLSSVFEAVYFVPLAAVLRATQIHDAIAEVLRLPSHQSTFTPLEQICAELAEQRTLLILDNFEQLAEESAPHVQALLDCLPQLTILITSRHRLGWPGEQEWPLRLLPTPPTSLPAEEVVEWASVKLFLDRARLARADFVLTERNSSDVVTLVQRLQGLPLALELAAARAGTLSPSAMLQQLEQPLEFLARRRSAGTPRHDSLRACIEWSLQLLPVELQQFWAHLSVFRGNWSLEAAREIGQTPQAQEWLEILRDNSLVLFHENKDGEGRFSMLEVLRQFAEQMLSPAERIEVQERHAKYFVALAERMEKHFARSGSWLGTPDDEQDHFQAVLDYALQNDVKLGLQLIGDLWWFWPMRSYLHEAREYSMQLLVQAQDLGGVDNIVRARAESCAGLMSYHAGELSRAQELMEAALQRFRAAEELNGEASALNALGTIALAQGDFNTARHHYERTLQIQRVCNDTRQIAVALSCLAEVEQSANDLNRSRALCREAFPLWRQLEDQGGVAWLLATEARIAESEGDWLTARTFRIRALELRRALGSPAGIATALHDMARLEHLESNWTQAREGYRESLLLRHELGHKREALSCLEGLAAVAPIHPANPIAPNGDGSAQSTLQPSEGAHNQVAIRAARVLGAAQAWRERLGFQRSPQNQALWQNSVSHLQNVLGASMFQSACAIGSGLSFDEAVQEALDLSRTSPEKLEVFSPLPPLA